MEQVVYKVIKSAGKKRLTEALEKYAPKPKDLKADGRKAFEELSAKQKDLLQKALVTKQVRATTGTGPIIRNRRVFLNLSVILDLSPGVFLLSTSSRF